MEFNQRFQARVVGGWVGGRDGQFFSVRFFVFRTVFSTTESQVKTGVEVW